jgi:quercetin dioxygenase-like cupin family protein
LALEYTAPRRGRKGVAVRTRGPWLAATVLGTLASATVHAAPLIDNERVTVWNVKLAKGESGPITPHDQDAVILFVEGGTIRTRDGHGKSSVAARNFGDGIFVPKGTDAVETLIAGGPVHEVVIALKEHPVASMANTSPYPAAFPRAGAVKVFENSRVILRNYSWTPGRPTVMHIHDKDFVVAFRHDSSQKIVEPDGSSHINQVKAGDILFLRRGLTHSEGLETERQSAVYMELK